MQTFQCVVDHYSELFYASTVVSAHSASDVPPIRGIYWPRESWERLVFVNVDASEQNTNGSFWNEAEVEVVRDILHEVLSQNKIDQAAVNSHFLGVISPYTEQCFRLRERLHFWNGLQVEASTVDGYQGEERELIVLSTVRANGTGAVGFLSDFRRLNVSISRAKVGTVVVGNANTLQHDINWGRLLSTLEDRGCLLSVFRDRYGHLCWSEASLRRLNDQTLSQNVPYRDLPKEVPTAVVYPTKSHASDCEWFPLRKDQNRVREEG